ncbi:MAG: rod shape-determining protein RodA [Anaerotignaceae bacterium]
MDIKKMFYNLDYWLIGAVCILSVFGIVCIGSATHINLGESASTYYSQMVWFAIGIVIMLGVVLVNYQFISQFYLGIYAANILLLIAVLIAGRSVNGATRWLYIGGVGIQPSEFSKIIIVVCLAKLIDKNRQEINNISVLAFIVAFVLIPILLIQKQPSLSASLVLLAVLIVELFVAGIDYKYILIALMVVIPIVAFICWDVQNETPIIVDKVLASHQVTRIKTFLNPVEGSNEYYQTIKSINAIGSGQMTGKGLYQGTLNQLSYLPEPHNDFIFSVIGEEFGFIGCVGVLIVEFFVVFRCILIAVSCRDLFSQLVVAGIAGMIAFQVFVNAGVATSILPNTGMSMPFVSYGGSSMWTNMASIGLVLNIGSKRSKSLFEGV